MNLFKQKLKISRGKRREIHSQRWFTAETENFAVNIFGPPLACCCQK